MNLKESIRRILREEFNPIRARRLIHIADEYISNLKPDDICTYWTNDEADDYINASMLEIVNQIMYKLHDMPNEEYGDYYDKIYNILLKFKYDKIIRNFFLESLDNCD